MNIFRYIHFFYMLGGITLSILAYPKLSALQFFICIIFYIYLLPPLIFQTIFRILFPQFKGDLTKLEARSYVGSATFTIWWVSSQMQVHFLRFPGLEEAIKWIPGCYSMWLRLWGAKIGKNVLWTPRVLIVDRPFLDIGDDVIIGTETRMTSHLANALKDERRVEVVLGIIKIGNGATLGGGSNTFPGGQVKPNQVIPAMGVVRNGILFDRPTGEKK